mmetsp:Transcript_9491/g.19675  ORF Transcript_9491/g.19675 Transcript_9491/m.19675 type:complete len:903 (-) Transcript_9491:132-2840(-)
MLNQSGIPKIMQYSVHLSKKESSLSSRSSEENVLNSLDHHRQEDESSQHSCSPDQNEDLQITPDLPSSKQTPPLSPPKNLRRKNTIPSTPPENFSSLPKLLSSMSSSLSQGSSLTSSSSLTSLSTPLSRPPSTKSPSRTPIPKTSVDPKEWLQWLDQHENDINDNSGKFLFPISTGEGQSMPGEGGEGSIFTARKKKVEGEGGTKLKDPIPLQMLTRDDKSNHSLLNKNTFGIPFGPDILMEGRYHLEMCIFSTVYSHLRSICVQGLTSVTLEDLEPETEHRTSAKCIIEKFANEIMHGNGDDEERIQIIMQQICDGNDCQSDFRQWITSCQVQKSHNKSSLLHFQSKTPNCRESKVSNNMIDSHLEVMRFGDATQNDIGYTIMVDRDKKLIHVTFHITSESQNHWLFKFDHVTSKCNPIRDNYVGKRDAIDIHAGLAWYLMSERKGTGMSKMQEIFDNIDFVGREIALSGNYQLGITGYSLGGAFATLVGFYAAASDQLAHIRKVKVFAFDSPGVGSSSFVHSHRYLEKTGKLQHASFSCNDLWLRRPSQYDVGLQVELHKMSTIGRFCRQRAFYVRYLPSSSVPVSSRQHCFRRGTKHSKFEFLRRFQFASRHRYIIHSIDGYYSIHNIRGSSPIEKKHRSAVFVMSWAGCIAVVFFSVVLTVYGIPEHVLPLFIGNFFDQNDHSPTKSVAPPSLELRKGSSIEMTFLITCDVKNAFDEIDEFADNALSIENLNELKSLRVDGASKAALLNVDNILPDEGSLQTSAVAYEYIPVPGDITSSRDGSVVIIENEYLDEFSAAPQTELIVHTKMTGEATDDFSGYCPHQPTAFVRNFGPAFINDALLGSKKCTFSSDHDWPLHDSTLYRLVKTRVYNHMWHSQVVVWDAANFLNRTRTIEEES